MRKIGLRSRFNSAHQNMISAVISFALSAGNIAVTQTIAAFLALMNLIKGKLDELIDLEGKVNNPVTGIADQKEVYKNALVQMSALIMQTVYAYAVKSGDQPLAAKMRITPSQLTRMKDSVLTGTVEGAITNVSGVLPELVSYNITQGLVDMWAANLDAFKGIASSPKVVHSEADAMRASIQDLLRECMILLYNQADTIAMQFKSSNLEYYRGYQKVRKLQPLVKHTKLRVLVTTELGAPVAHVKVQQDGTSNYIITDMNGRADLYIQPVKGSKGEPKGIYEFTLSKDTMSLKTGEIKIKKGHTVTRNVVMNEHNFVIPPVVEENETVNK